ncbi:uncharacterized protein At5g08430 [Coffea arabica]|uniref:Uncharacterized protein At5g08430 n=1 Tax=Coffea arabica TaxID=13443 RepID=A0A6P6VUS2_COFAR
MKDTSSFWVEESSDPSFLPMKKRRKVRKLEFVGWGSKPLMEFLESIGKDTSKKLNQYEVTAIMNEYINANNLADPAKKKKIMCDQWLYALFGKRSIPRIKVYDLLEAHFAENHDSSEDDSQYSSEEEGGNITYMNKKASTLEHKLSYQQKKVPESPKSCFAAVIPENIKLVYLKRSLVQDLVTAPESFEDKLMGSFVKIKSDPDDYLQKNSHQLQQIIGIQMIEAGDGSKEVYLRLSNYMKEVRIQMLSDDNFSEAECQDLRERVKAGLLKRPTVVELEMKAKMLHKDITKHWIPRQIALLQKFIDRANEKGWRREMFEHLERKEQLVKSSEQERLLAETPKVIADEIEPEATPVDALEKVEERNSSSPKSSHLEASNINLTYDAGCADVGIHSRHSEGNSDKEISGSLCEIPCVEDVNDCQHSDLVQKARVPVVVNGEQSSTDVQAVDSEDNGGSPGISEKEVKPAQVIELSDDESEVEDVKIEKHTAVGNPDECLWHYLDPQGMVQGPFSMTSLKRWSDANYFDRDFKVWKMGESLDKAVLLIDALRQNFPCKEIEN